MTRDELKALVKKHFNLTEKKFATAELLDGTRVTNQSDEDFAIGQTLYVITEEGDVVAPSGSHETADFIVAVDEAGTITAITEKEAPVAEVVMEAEVPAIVEETVGAEKAEEVVSDIQGMIESLVEDAIEHVVEAIADEVTELKKRMAEMEDKFGKQFTSAPTMEQKFSKLQDIKKENKLSTFDPKDAQKNLILEQMKKKQK
jgi:hypothetical protein